GAGSSGHLSMELLKAKARIDLAHVPYKGTGQALQDVLAGRVPVIFDNVAPLLPYINSGALLALGVSTPNRIASLPDIPAVAETVPGFEASSWVAIVAPAKTEAGIINRLNATANQILLDPVVKDRLATLGATPAGGSSAELGTFLGEEKTKWRDVISQAGLMVEAK
ncbi:MAG: tripartite tricarboxylate transporter substrate-binding protein, partial [Pseudolabrys sp.]